MIDGWGNPCEITLIWMTLDLTDDKSTLVWIVAWCCQSTSHYLSQCWPRSMASLGHNELTWETCTWVQFIDDILVIIKIQWKICFPVIIWNRWNLFRSPMTSPLNGCHFSCFFLFLFFEACSCVSSDWGKIVIPKYKYDYTALPGDSQH